MPGLLRRLLHGSDEPVEVDERVERLLSASLADLRADPVLRAEASAFIYDRLESAPERTGMSEEFSIDIDMPTHRLTPREADLYVRLYQLDLDQAI